MEYERKSIMNKKHNGIGVFLIFAIMLLAPFIENTRGIFIPMFKDEFGVSNTLISTAITVGAASSLFVSLFGGPIIGKLGQKGSFTVSLAFVLSGILLQTWSRSFFLFALGLVPISMGIALYNVSANTIIPFMFFSIQTVIMNILHAMYGVGSTIAQNLTGTLLSMGIGWRTIYLGVSVAYFLLAFLSRFAVIPEIPRAKEEIKVSGRKLMRDPLVIAFGLALGFYAFSEFGVSLWLTNYLKTIYGYPESTGARYVGFFFLLFSAGRLLGGFVVQKIGTFRAVAGTLVISLALMLSGLLLGERFLIVVSIAGLFYSIVYPSLISKVGAVFPDSTAHAMGYVITIINVVLNGMNQVMGMLTDAIGPGLSIFLIPACLVAALAATAFIGSRTKGILK